MKNCWAEKIQEFATNTPDKVAIIDEETKLTYKKLWEYSCGFAKYLKQQGHQKGQVVICQAYGKIAYVVTYVATLIAKGIFSPIDKETVLSKFLDQKECLPDVFCVVHNFDYTFEREVKIDDVLSIAQQNAEFLTVEFDVNDDAQILFTSGSTLKPKAVLTTNAQLLQGKDVAKVLGHQSDTVGLLMSPVHHYAFFGLALPFFIVGGTYVMFNVFNIKKALDLVVEHKVNAFFATPSIYKMLSVVAKDKFSQIFANARSLFTGAEFVPQPVKDWLRKEAPNSGLYAIYGATETAFVAIHRFDVEEKPFGCVGPLLPGVEVEIRDVGANVVAIKSPHVMKKYLGREDHQGWVETSDLAFGTCRRRYRLGWYKNQPCRN